MRGQPAAVLSAILVLAITATADSGPPAPVELVPTTAAQVLDAVRTSWAKAGVVNVWATWCIPCRQEFPDLVRLRRAYAERGLTLLLVSGDLADDTGPAKEFLAAQGVDFRTYLKAQKDQDFIDAFDPAWSGALPATFVYDGKGERRHSFLGAVTYAALEREITPLLAAKP